MVLLMAAGIEIGIGYAQPNSLSDNFKAFRIVEASDTLRSGQELLLIDLLDSSLGSLAKKDRQGRMAGG